MTHKEWAKRFSQILAHAERQALSTSLEELEQLREQVLVQEKEGISHWHAAQIQGFRTQLLVKKRRWNQAVDSYEELIAEYEGELKGVQWRLCNAYTGLALLKRSHGQRWIEDAKTAIRYGDLIGEVDPTLRKLRKHLTTVKRSRKAKRGQKKQK